MTDCLDIYFHARLAGQLKQRRTDGKLRFKYNEKYLESPNCYSLSVALPIQSNPHNSRVTSAFFAGLLPGEPKNVFKELKNYINKPLGEILICREGENFTVSRDYQYLNNDELEKVLKNESPTENQLPLLGTQIKCAVLVNRSKLIPTIGLSLNIPTSHILKPAINQPDRIFNEFFCMQLAEKVGINTATTHIRTDDAIDFEFYRSKMVADVFGIQSRSKLTNMTPFVSVQRYDFIRQDDRIIRLHQEDLCQALGKQPHKKFDITIMQSLGIIRNNSINPDSDCREFIKRVIFNYLIGNNDAHGKNFSFLYIDGKPQLAPAYDLLSTAAYPGEFDNKMAMSIGGERDSEKVSIRNWRKLIKQADFPNGMLEADLKYLASTLPALSSWLQSDLGKEWIMSPIFSIIIDIITKRSAEILKHFT